MVTREVDRTANQVEMVLEERSIVGLMTVALGTASGVYAAQYVADTVLPMVGLSSSPESVTDAVGAIGVKGAGALATGYLSAQTSGLAATALAFAAVGMLTSGGFDLVNLFVDVPELAQTRGTRGRALNQGPTAHQQAQTASATVQAQSPAQTQTATAGGGNF